MDYNVKLGHRVLTLLCASLLAGGVYHSATVHGQNVQESTIGRSQQDIRNTFQQYRPLSRGFDYMSTTDIYEQVPRFESPMDPGKLKKVYIEDGLKAVNFVRYLAGLPNDVEADWNLEKQEQAAALVNALNGGLSHNPTQPANMDNALFSLASAGAGSSNLYAGDPTLYSNVTGYMSDSDSSNIDRVGHRRWIMNPRMKKTMFGFIFKSMETPYQNGAMYVFNKDRSESEVQYDYISWPSAGYFPKELFAPSDAWSVSVNPNTYDKTRTSSIQVNLTRVRDGKSWSFNETNKDRSGKYFNVEKSGFGVPYCIIFRPDDLKQFEAEDKFKVDIQGIYLKGGQETTISFETTMFDMGSQASFRTDSIQLTPGEQLHLYTGLSNVGEEGSAPLFSSSDSGIVEVDQNGNLTAKRSGTANIVASQYFKSSEVIRVTVKNAVPKDQVSIWARDYYNKAKANGIVSMSSDSGYQKPVNRYTFALEALKIYENVMGKPSDHAASPFKDINDTQINLAYQLNLIKGTSETQFSPWKTLTRQESATIINNMVQIFNEHKQSTASANGVAVQLFKDDSSIAAWAKDSVYRSVDLGLLTGMGNNKFQPTEKLTLEQSYVMLQKLLDLYE
ncbi:MAG: S-layer homology domain-containing protein [Paenibacillus sp.]|nr:S-layer homology domain-containing protein [Paenibacillus sp.]